MEVFSFKFKKRFNFSGLPKNKKLKIASCVITQFPKKFSTFHFVFKKFLLGGIMNRRNFIYLFINSLINLFLNAYLFIYLFFVYLYI